MKRLARMFAAAAILAFAAASAGDGARAPEQSASASHRSFEAASRDGTVIRGVADIPRASPAAVIMVAGTGMFDRDMRFGRSGTPRDLVFRDLADRLTSRGLAVIRYDRRGIRYDANGASRVLAAEARTSTVAMQREDLAAVYRWSLENAGFAPGCVVFLAHSEGIRHVAGLAQAKLPPPRLVVGIGAPMRSPSDVLHWQIAERATYALRMMDTDGDGAVSAAEVEANWRSSPAEAFPGFAQLRRHREFSKSDLAQLSRDGLLLYARERKKALELSDAAPFPNARSPIAQASWWKSWFTDDTPIAARLSAWPARVILHYGSIDSQVQPRLEAATAKAILGDRASVEMHPGKGHTLGDDALLGPMDERIADELSQEIAAAARGCAG